MNLWRWKNDKVRGIACKYKKLQPHSYCNCCKEEIEGVKLKSMFDDAGELVHTVTMERREVGFLGHEILDGEAILRDEETHREEE